MKVRAKFYGFGAIGFIRSWVFNVWHYPDNGHLPWVYGVRILGLNLTLHGKGGS